MKQLRMQHVGALVGLIFGLAVIHYGFIRGVFLLALAVAGWFIGRVLDGELDVSDYLRRRDEGPYE